MTRIFSGTATVTNGDATVVITSGVLTAANCPDDAPIALNGVAYHVLSRTDSTHLELTRNYAGTTGSVVVEIDPLTPAALSVVNVAVLVANVQAQLNVLDKNSQGLFYNRIGVTGDTDPAPGNLAFNNSDPTAVTEFYVDNLDANERSVTGLIDLWTAGTIVLIRSLATTAYTAYRLPSGASAQSGYYRASAQYVDHDGVLADGEAVSIGWFRVGEGLEIDAVGDYAGRSAYNASPAGFVYLSSNGNTTTVTVAALFRKNSATSGDWSAAVPFQGIAGDKGWAPRFAVVADGERRVMQLAGYVGGSGTTPTANVGQYVATGGYTATIASATDIRGAAGETGEAGTNGTNGVDGADGLDGTDPGVIMIWDNGTTDANPGSGVVRANNALTSSATFLYVSKANRPGDDISAFLATLDDSNSNRKGIITITKSGGGAQTTFDVTGLTDATGYVKVAVVNGSGATFADNDIVSFQFAPAGDRGTDGLGAGNFVTPDTPAIDPTGYLVKFTDATGAAGATAGILASDVLQKSDNLMNVGNRTTANDNLHVNGADIASAATVNLETATGIFVEVTGTTTTTAITLSDGHQRLVRAAAAWPLTHGANLQIHGGASYTCAAGDLLLVQADGAVIRVTIFPVSGQPVARVTNAKLAQVATATIKGRTTAGTGDVEDLTATQATALLNGMVGDSGSGGTKGLVPAPAAGDAAASKFLKADGTWKTAAGGGSRNYLINPFGMFNELGDTTISDDTYGWDCHNILTAANPITISTLAATSDGLPNMMRMTQANVAIQRMGNSQMLSARDSLSLRGKQVSLGGRLSFSVSAPVRFAVLEWTGTADAITSDVISSWANGTYTAGQFFIGTGITVAAVGSITPAANTLTDWNLLATISSSMNNLVVLYWTEGNAAQSVTLDMAWFLVEGDSSGQANPFAHRSEAEEKALCNWYLFPIEPGRFATGQVTATTQADCMAFFPPMRVAPTAIFRGAASTYSAINSTGTGVACTAIVMQGTPTKSAIRFRATVASGLVVGNASALSSTDRILLDARL